VRVGGGYVYVCVVCVSVHVCVRARLCVCARAYIRTRESCVRWKHWRGVCGWTGWSEWVGAWEGGGEVVEVGVSGWV
jgi:hypothetical protein